jgi:hypothetical protein
VGRAAGRTGRVDHLLADDHELGQGAGTTAMLYSVVALVSGLAFTAVVVFGVGVIVNK